MPSSIRGAPGERAVRAGARSAGGAPVPHALTPRPIDGDATMADVAMDYGGAGGAESSGNNASMSDTLYSAELRGVLEGSLSSLLPVLPLPLARHEAIEGAFKPSGPRHFQRSDSHPREVPL